MLKIGVCEKDENNMDIFGIGLEWTRVSDRIKFR